MAKASELKDKFQRTVVGEGRAPAPSSAPMASAPATLEPSHPSPQLRSAPEPQEVVVPVAMAEPARHPKQTVRITADIDKDLHRGLKQFCLDNDCNGQDVVRYLLHLGLVADTDLRSAVAQYVSRPS